MKVLVATDRSQGMRPTDVMECVDGELVFLVEACPYSRRYPYRSCDCGVTFRGMSSDAVTSTALVRSVGLSHDEYVACLAATHELRTQNGCTCAFDPAAEAWRLLAIVGPLAEGTVVERNVDRIRARAT